MKSDREDNMRLPLLIMFIGLAAMMVAVVCGFIFALIETAKRKRQLR